VGDIETAGLTLTEIEQRMPRGLAEGLLLAVTLRPAMRELELAVDAVVEPAADGSARYRGCVIKVAGIAWLEFGPEKLKLTDAPMRLESGVLEGERLAALGKPAVRPPLFAHWVFCHSTGSFIYLAAERASLEWLDEPHAGPERESTTQS
jgi:hypothetical protein